MTIAGSAAAALATLLIGATFALRRLAASVVELTVGIGLLRRRPWAREPAYAILGG